MHNTCRFAFSQHPWMSEVVKWTKAQNLLVKTDRYFPLPFVWPLHAVSFFFSFFFLIFFFWRGRGGVTAKLFFLNLKIIYKNQLRGHILSGLRYMYHNIWYWESAMVKTHTKLSLHHARIYSKETYETPKTKIWIFLSVNCLL